MKKILGCLRRADQDFSLIQPGDRIAVGVSGGKDSLALLKALKLYQYFSKKPYALEAITLTMGLGPVDLSGIRAFCAELGIGLTVEETLIGKIVFEIRQEKNPCALCANLRRGALHNAALKLNCNKVALGHHREDLLETFLMSLLFEGRLHTFSPKVYLDRKKITVIRPLVYAPEKDIASLSRREGYPILKSPCPANGLTKRQDMEELLGQMCAIVPDAREKLLHALKGGLPFCGAQTGREEDV